MLPVPWDATCSYRVGTAEGPTAMLHASHQVDLYDMQTGRPYEAGIALHPESEEVRAWNTAARAEMTRARGEQGTAQRDAISEVNRLSEKMNGWVYERTQRALARGQQVGLVGGEHSTPLGAICAHVEAFPKMGILHIDAHADLREAYEGAHFSHASIMHNVLKSTTLQKLVQVGLRDVGSLEVSAIAAEPDRIDAVFDHEIQDHLSRGKSFDALAKYIVSRLPQEVYISFDIDGLDPTLCPNTGTPVPGGLSFSQAIYLVGTVVRSGRRIVGFDLVEVAPGEHGDWDANVGARILYKLCGYLIASCSASKSSMPSP